jgi:outer membrane protein OmpA-like peptidoglycan-associated protein
MKRFSTLLFFVLSLSFQAVQAQVASLTLMGNVQSNDRKAVAGAAITIIHVPSGARYAAASNSSGRFAIADLQPGGPYVMQVGEGHHRPETVESIFLEKGKTANFTVTLSKPGEAPGKEQFTRTTGATREMLSNESVVGGPVLITTINGGYARAKTSSQVVTASVSGTTSMAGATAPDASTPRSTPAARPDASRYRRTSSYNFGPTKGAAPLVTGHFDAKSGNYIYETGQPTTIKLPSGDVIKEVGINSTESHLYRFLNDPQAQIDTVDLTKGWYNFDRVFFNPGKATLTAESISQLRNVATLLRAFPKSRVKLGGYTDSTGTYKVNKQLSDARARTAWASLVEMGISPSRIEARGYGPRYSIAPNATEEGRAMNRRLSVKVLMK